MLYLIKICFEADIYDHKIKYKGAIQLSDK